MQIFLQGRITYLRDMTVDDLDAIESIAGDDRVTTWLSFESRDRDGCRAMLTAAMQNTQADPRMEYYLAITTRESESMIGFARLALGGVKAGKLGYAINADHWGKGYAQDAVAALVDFGFRSLDLHRITAATGPENAASRAVLNRLGFTYEGQLRSHVFTNGNWRDSLLYSLLVEEWVSS